MKLMFILVGIFFTNCFADVLNGKIIVEGSSALLPLTLAAKYNLKQAYPQLNIMTSGQGSSTGIQAVKTANADIAAVDWDASTEIENLNANPKLIAYPIAITPYATVVNLDVKIKSLNQSQLQGIFSGKYTNWKDVGGNDLPIVVINREQSYGSGTRLNYQIKALGNIEFMRNGENYKEVKSSVEMRTNVASIPGAIGYLDLAYIKNSYVKPIEFNNVAATEENIINGKYPIWSYGYYVTNGEPNNTMKQFIGYVQSSEFQHKTLPKMGYIPIDSIKK